MKELGSHHTKMKKKTTSNSVQRSDADTSESLNQPSNSSGSSASSSNVRKSGTEDAKAIKNAGSRQTITDNKEKTLRRKRSSESESNSAKGKKTKTQPPLKPLITGPKAKQTIFVRLPPKMKFDRDRIETFFISNGLKIFEVREVKGRNYGFVDLSDTVLMPQALKLNGQSVDGMELLVEIANEKPTYSPKPNKAEVKAKLRAEEEERKRLIEEKVNRSRLFVRNLPAVISEKILLDHFPEATEIRLPVDADNKYMGYGHLEFMSEAVADKVMMKMQGSLLNGQAIVLEYLGNKCRNDQQCSTTLASPTSTLLAKNLAQSLTDEDIKKAFVKCKLVLRSNLCDADKSQSEAYIQYDSVEDAAADLKAMNGSKLCNETISVLFTQLPQELVKLKESSDEPTEEQMNELKVDQTDTQSADCSQALNTKKKAKTKKNTKTSKSSPVKQKTKRSGSANSSRSISKKSKKSKGNKKSTKIMTDA